MTADRRSPTAAPSAARRSDGRDPGTAPTTAAARGSSPWGPEARALAARAAGDGLGALAAAGLVRLSFVADALPAPAHEELLAAALHTTVDARGRRTWLGPRVALEGLAGTAPLLAAFDAAVAPPPAPRLVGVLNVTPDSFSDGGRFDDVERAVAHGRELLAAGAAWLDVGGESTRPGAAPVPVEEERARVVPVVERLAAEGLGPISIDTRRSAVAGAAIDAGARLVNDVEAGLHDARMLPLVAERGVGYAAMHMLGHPATMQTAPRYGDVVDEVAEFLRGRLAACVEAGVAPEAVWLDPGIGFGKTLEHNLALLARLGELRSLGCPLFVGVSRKRFIGTLTEEPVAARRLHGTSAAVAWSIACGAEFLRVHDVAELRAVAAVTAAVRDAGREGLPS